MKRYEKYKDSGIEWIGKIPQCWEIIKTRYILQERKNRNKSNERDLLSVSEYYGVARRIDKIQVGDILTRAESLDDYKVVFKNDLVINIMLAWKKGLGVSDYDGIVSPAYCVYTFKKGINPKYYHYLYRTDLYADYFKVNSTGIIDSRLRLYSENLFQVESILPSTVEQTAIANYLDRKTTEIDELITDKKRLLELYEEEKTAIINQAVTKGIDPNVPMKDSGIEWLGEIPEHWEVKRSKNIARVQTGSTPKIHSSEIDCFKNGYINWFTPSDFENNNELTQSKRKLISDTIEKGEVEVFPKFSIYLVSIGATLGKVSFFKDRASANQQINVISFNSKKYNPLFGYYFLVGNKGMITLEADFTTLPILNQSKSKNLFFVFPPLEEQQSIVHYIKTECARIDAKKANAEKLIELLTEYRTALISEAVTGKIKVTD